MFLRNVTCFFSDPVCRSVDFFEGSVGFQAKLRKLCEECIDIFSTRVRHQSAKVEPMSIIVDRGKWEVSRN